jgi:hypothetical protein
MMLEKADITAATIVADKIDCKAILTFEYRLNTIEWLIPIFWEHDLVSSGVGEVARERYKHWDDTQ